MLKFVSLISKSNVMRWLIILVLVINWFIIDNSDAQCEKVVLQGRLTNFYKSDIPSDFQCYLTVSVDKVLVGNNLIDVTGKRVEPGYTLHTSWNCPTLPPLQIGDCVELSGGWCNRDSPPIYREHNYYAKKITCPDGPGPTPQCPPGPIGSPQCSENVVRQQYQDANCNRYWQTVDDCNRYIPSKCCTNGACQKCGPQETYRCVNNVVQRLVVDNGVEKWQVFDDCNSYDPPRRCIGGVCVESEDPTPEDECDLAACQEQNGPIGIPYSIDGKTYQRYNECNCIENECSCESIPKEVPKTEIKFLGTAIRKHLGGMPGEPDYWTVNVDQTISGPRYSGELDVITRQAINEIWGQEDPDIKEGNRVEVYGEYQEQENGVNRVVLYGSDQYYIKRSSGTIQGNVYDAATESPVINAVIKVAGETSSGNTDNNGHYMINGFCPLSTYKLNCYHQGYMPGASEVVTDSDGNKEKADFILEPTFWDNFSKLDTSKWDAGDNCDDSPKLISRVISENGHLKLILIKVKINQVLQMRLISRRVTNWVLEHIQLNSKQHLAIKVKVLFLHFYVLE